jgi:hypothetical protein
MKSADQRFEHTLCAPIPVMIGVAEQAPDAIQQRETHRPGVDADPGQKALH